MQKVIILVSIIILATNTLFAQLRSILTEQRIGTADLIILGTINAITDPGKATGTVEVKVDQVLKGEKLDTVIISNLAWMVGPNGAVLPVNEQRLLFLQCAQGGYSLVRGALGVRPAGEADAIAVAIKTFPVDVTFTAPVKPAVIGALTPLIAVVKNTADHPITISTIKPQGYYNDAAMGQILYDIIRPERNGLHVAPWLDNITIEAGKSYAVTLQYSFMLPAAWKDTPADTEKETPITLRMQVQVDLHTPRKNDADSYYVNSPVYLTKLVLPKRAPQPETPAAKTREEGE